MTGLKRGCGSHRENGCSGQLTWNWVTELTDRSRAGSVLAVRKITFELRHVLARVGFIDVVVDAFSD